tara:strand:+ start:577 stop:1182 length:606 start_codon:yes stop_codon:yes gene_type:complete
MPFNKIQSEGFDLTDNYAFTGTVTGAGSSDFVKLITTTISSNVSSVDFGSSYINSTYKVYKIYYRGLKLTGTDNIGLRIGASGTLLTSGNYQKGGMAQSYESTSFGGISGTSDTAYTFGGHHENSASGQEMSGEITLYDLVNNTPNKACVHIGNRVGTGANRFDVKGFMNPNTQTCDIISLFTIGSANMSAGQISLYGIKE